MHKHILIATDGSELAQRGVATGLALARATGAKVTAVTVSEPLTHLVPDVGFIEMPEDNEEALQALEIAAEAARRADVRCETVHVKNQYPAEALLREAEVRHCDLIVMASHGRGALGRALLGGETVRVITLSHVPVLVCK